MHDLPRGDVRLASGKQRPPSGVIIDSQSITTTEKWGSAALMRTNGSTAASVTKRHILVDTLELLLAVVLTAASV